MALKLPVWRALVFGHLNILFHCSHIHLHSTSITKIFSSKPKPTHQYQNQMAHWARLPAQLKLEIFKLVAADQVHRLSNYACVSDEWQSFFESITFKQLVLKSSGTDLDQFPAAVHGRLNLIRQIVLRIELDEYDCTVCNRDEDEDTMTR